MGVEPTGTSFWNWPLCRFAYHAAEYDVRESNPPGLLEGQATVSPEVKEIAWKAQHRLHARYRHLTAKGKCKQEVVTAVGRELLGFIWAIGVKVEAQGGRQQSAAA